MQELQGRDERLDPLLLIRSVVQLRVVRRGWVEEHLIVCSKPQCLGSKPLLLGVDSCLVLHSIDYLSEFLQLFMFPCTFHLLCGFLYSVTWSVFFSLFFTFTLLSNVAFSFSVIVLYSIYSLFMFVLCYFSSLLACLPLPLLP